MDNVNLEKEIRKCEKHLAKIEDVFEQGIRADTANFVMISAESLKIAFIVERDATAIRLRLLKEFQAL